MIDISLDYRQWTVMGIRMDYLVNKGDKLRLES